MKKSLKQLLAISCAVILFMQLSFAQTCPIVKDSITSGSNATAYHLYSYDLQDRLVKVIRVDSGGPLAGSNYDTLIYGGNGMLSSVENRDGANDSLIEKVMLTYNGSNQITMLVASDANATWSMTHTVTYAGGDMTSIDMTDSTGQPQGFAASFTNIVYAGGNLTKVHLVGDLGGGGVDTLELLVAYDTKNNLEAMLYVNEPSDLLGLYNANNITVITFENAEVLGPAGTVVIQTTYTYNPDNNVETITELPGLFDDNSFVRKYFYDCSVLGIDEQVEVVMDLYPNPFMNAIHVSLNELGGQSFDLILVNILGVEVLNERYHGVSTVNLVGLEDLKSGLYFLQIKYNDSTITQKLVKE